MLTYFYPLPLGCPTRSPVPAWISAGIGKDRKREEQKIIKMKMEAAKIYKVKAIKKTFICEDDQSGDELRKNYQKILIFVCFPMRGEEKSNHPGYMMYLFCLK